MCSAYFSISNVMEEPYLLHQHCLKECHIPQALSAWINPRFFPILASREKTPNLGNSLFQGDSSNRICASRYQKLYIKSIINEILDIIKIVDSPNRVGSRGYQVPDGCVQSTTRTYTRSLTNLSRVHILPTCLMDDQSLAQLSSTSAIVTQTLVL